MINDPMLTVWLRLICVLLVFFVLSVAIVSQPMRSKRINTDRVLYQSAKFVFLGAALPLYMYTKFFSILGAIGFWCALLGTACLSRQGHIRRCFYVLFGVYVVMLLIGIFGEIVMGLISMAHA